MKVKLAVQPIPKSLVRVGCAGDFLKNVALGTLSDAHIRNIQQGIAEGIIERIIVTGIDARGLPRERFWLKFDPLADDVKVMLDLEGGKSTLEAVDVGLAGGVHTAVQTLTRKSLRPDVSFEYTAAAKANPVRLQEACQRLGFTERAPLAPLHTDPPVAPTPYVAPPYTPPPRTGPFVPTSFTDIVRQMERPPPPGYAFKTAVTITPAKDDGIHFGWDTLRRS